MHEMTTTHLAFILAALWAFWLLYVFTMGLYRAFLLGRLRGLSLVLCAPVVAVAALVDLLMQRMAHKVHTEHLFTLLWEVQ
jgi:hypothetical protein